MLKDAERQPSDLSLSGAEPKELVIHGLGVTIRKGRKLAITSGLAVFALTLSRAEEPKSAASNWAFQIPRASVATQVKNTDWPWSPIDSFILAKLEKAGLNLSLIHI